MVEQMFICWTSLPEIDLNSRHVKTLPYFSHIQSWYCLIQPHISTTREHLHSYGFHYLILMSQPYLTHPLSHSLYNPIILNIPTTLQKSTPSIKQPINHIKSFTFTGAIHAEMTHSWQKWYYIQFPKASRLTLGPLQPVILHVLWHSSSLALWKKRLGSWNEAFTSSKIRTECSYTSSAWYTFIKCKGPTSPTQFVLQRW